MKTPLFRRCAAIAATVLLTAPHAFGATTLVCEWKFENNLNDTSFTGNHGAAAGSPTYVPGRFGQGIQLARADKIQKLAAVNLPLGGNDSWSINLWVNLPAQPESLAYVAGFGPVTFVNNDPEAVGTGRALLAFGGGGNKNIYVWGLGTPVDLGTPNAYPTGAWKMLTVTHDGVSGVTKVYLDAQQIASGVQQLSMIPPGQSQISLAPTSHWGKDLDGSFDEFTVWSGVLTPCQIEGLRGGNKQLDLQALEVIQVVQNWSNSVPLVEGKETYVRAHLRAGGLPITVPGSFRGFQLRGSRNGVELGAPLTPVNAAGAVWLPAGTASLTDAQLMDRRAQWTNTVNFKLPPEWRSNVVDLRFEWTGGSLSCSEPAEPGGQTNDGVVRASFVKVPLLRLRLFDMQWTNSLGTVRSLAPSVAADIPVRVLSVFPCASVTSLPGSSLTVPGAWNETTLATNGALRYAHVSAALNTLLPVWGADRQTNSAGDLAFYGALSADGLPPTGVAAAGNPGTGYERTNLYSVGRIVPAHEIAHTFNRPHTGQTPGIKGPCNEDFGTNGDVFPHFFPLGPGGQIVPALGPMSNGVNSLIFGLDTYVLNLLPTLNPVVDPRTCFEMMSYCKCNPEDPRSQWISAYNYTNIMAKVIASAPTPPPGGVPSGLLAAAAAAPECPSVLISGTVQFPSGAVDLRPLVAAPGPPLDEIPAPGEYMYVLLDENNFPILERPFAPVEVDDAEEGDRFGIFSIRVPCNPAYRTLQILSNGVVVASRSASLQAPTVTLLSPNGGETHGPGPVAISWSASDFDGDSLSFHVQYSADNGATWATLVAEWTGTNYTTDHRHLLGTASGRFRVVASDGFHSASDESDAPFTVANHPPELSITAPLHNGRFVDDQQIIFLADARDLEDQLLTVTWTSDRDGLLGTGPEIHRLTQSLSEGVHVISCQAVDSGSLTRSAQVTIEVDYLRVRAFPGPTPSTIIIEWHSPNAVLQFATQLLSPPAVTQWQDLPGVESGDLVPKSGPGRFYRLKR